MLVQAILASEGQTWPREKEKRLQQILSIVGRSDGDHGKCRPNPVRIHHGRMQSRWMQHQEPSHSVGVHGK